MLYLEDIHVGDQFHSREYEISLDEIKKFAQLYDPQPFHVDENQAIEHPIFQGISASGWHTSAIMMRLWTECMPIAYGLIGCDATVRWPRPTRPGDRLHVEVTINAIHPSKSKNDRAIVAYTTQVLNQNHDPVLISSTRIVVFKRDTHLQ